jgi:hypothetical protein
VKSFKPASSIWLSNSGVLTETRFEGEDTPWSSRSSSVMPRHPRAREEAFCVLLEFLDDFQDLEEIDNEGEQILPSCVFGCFPITFDPRT